MTVEFSFELWTVFDDPAVNRRMIDAHLAFECHFFQVSGAQGIRHVPLDEGQDDFFWKIGAFEADGADQDDP